MSSPDDRTVRLRERLQDAHRIADPFKRRLYLLGVITEALAATGVVPILVGGGAVEFYTMGSYVTADLDVVVPEREKFGVVLKDLGFAKGVGKRHWYSEEFDLAIEVPDSSLAGSRERVVQVEVENAKVLVIGLEDLILDRLRAFVFWRSTSDGEWAGRMMALHEGDVDWNYLRQQAKKEGLADALERVRQGP